MTTKMTAGVDVTGRPSLVVDCQRGIGRLAVQTLVHDAYSTVHCHSEHGPLFLRLQLSQIITNFVTIRHINYADICRLNTCIIPQICHVMFT